MQEADYFIEYFLCPLGIILFILVAISLYFLPSIIAFSRKHRNAIPIFILNLLTALTGFGWVVSLVWAFTNNTNRINIESEMKKIIKLKKQGLITEEEFEIKKCNF